MKRRYALSTLVALALILFGQACVTPRTGAPALAKAPAAVFPGAEWEKVADPEKAGQAAASGKSGDEAYVQAGGEADEAVMPAGQVAGLIRAIVGAGEVFPDMVQGARALAGSLEKFFKEDM